MRTSSRFDGTKRDAAGQFRLRRHRVREVSARPDVSTNSLLRRIKLFGHPAPENPGATFEADGRRFEARVGRKTHTDAVASIAMRRRHRLTQGYAPDGPHSGEAPNVRSFPCRSDPARQVLQQGLRDAIPWLALGPVASPVGWPHIGETAPILFRFQSGVTPLFRPGHQVQVRPRRCGAATKIKHRADGGVAIEVRP